MTTARDDYPALVNGPGSTVYTEQLHEQSSAALDEIDRLRAAAQLAAQAIGYWSTHDSLSPAQLAATGTFLYDALRALRPLCEPTR